MSFLGKFKSNKTLYNGSLFSLFSFINQGISFVLLILLANYIAPAEYGQLSLFNTIVQFLGYFVALSTQGYISVSYFKSSHELFRKDVSSIFLICLIISLFFCLITALLGGLLIKVVEFHKSFLWFAIIISFTQIFQGMWLDYYRIQERVGIYGVVSCGAAILNLVLSLYLVIFAGFNWAGRVYAQVICSVLFGVAGLLFFFYKRIPTKQIEWNNVKTVALWGIPLIPHLAAIWIKQGGDRFIINYYHNVEDVGLFSFAINLASIIIVIGTAFNSSNSVSIYKILSSTEKPEEKRQLLKRQTRNIAIITIIAYVGVVLGASLLVPLLLPKYTASIPYFYILSIQGLGQCFYFLCCNYLFYYSRNKQIMYISFTSAILHLCLSLIVTRYSLYLTCLIYVISQIYITGLIYLKSRRAISENLV